MLNRLSNRFPWAYGSTWLQHGSLQLVSTSTTTTCSRLLIQQEPPLKEQILMKLILTSASAVTSMAQPSLMVNSRSALSQHSILLCLIQISSISSCSSGIVVSFNICIFKIKFIEWHSSVNLTLIQWKVANLKFSNTENG